GHKHPSIREECDRPRRVEVGDSLDGERMSGTCRSVAGIDAPSLGGAVENERDCQYRQCHECLVPGHVSSAFVRPSTRPQWTTLTVTGWPSSYSSCSVEAW